MFTDSMVYNFLYSNSLAIKSNALLKSINAQHTIDDFTLSVTMELSTKTASVVLYPFRYANCVPDSTFASSNQSQNPIRIPISTGTHSIIFLIDWHNYTCCP